jgi:hypothetical protein
MPLEKTSSGNEREACQTMSILGFGATSARARSCTTTYAGRVTARARLGLSHAPSFEVFQTQAPRAKAYLENYPIDLVS